MEIGTESVVIDYSGFGGNDKAQNFYAELTLRQLWNDIQAGKRQNLVILVDEAHRLIRSEYSIIERMCREIRHRGCIWISTQNLFDVRGEARSSLATKFVFRLGDVDLQIVRQVNPILHFAAATLQPRLFIDAEFPEMN